MRNPVTVTGNRAALDLLKKSKDEGLSLVNANILEGTSEGTEDTKETPEEALPRPNRSASTEEWAKYAESLGIRRRVTPERS